MRRMVAAVVVAAALCGGCYVSITDDGVSVGIMPALAYIPGTPIQVVNSDPNLLFYDGFYWRYYNGMWQRSAMWNAGWVVYNTVPRVFLDIPATHPAHLVVQHHPLYRPVPTVVKHPLAPVVKTPIGGGAKVPVGGAVKKLLKDKD